MKKFLLCIIILISIILAGTIYTYAVTYKATFQIKDQNTGSYIPNSSLQIRGNGNFSFDCILPSGNNYTNLEANLVFGYNARATGYAARYSASRTMP